MILNKVTPNEIPLEPKIDFYSTSANKLYITGDVIYIRGNGTNVVIRRPKS